MGSALLNTVEDQAVAEVAGTGGQPATAEPRRAEALRQEVAERLAAHRRRRAGAQTQPKLDLAPEPSHPAKSRSARIAAAVAERYAQTQSYRAFLAAEAERAIQQAHAAAEVAAMNAQAVAAAQQRLLDAFDEAATKDVAHQAAQDSAHPQQIEDAGQAEFQEIAGVELNLWPDLEAPAQDAKAEHAKTSRPTRAPKRGTEGAQAGSWVAPGTAPLAGAQSPGLTVRLYEDSASAAHVYLGTSQRVPNAGRANHYEERNEAEAMALDEEIAFRQAPVFEEPAGPPVPLPANLIEFPRQLVASRKARPRYAEGPLRDEEVAAPGDSQLRIFEVDPAQISIKPAAESEADTTATPQWTSIWLDAPAGATRTAGSQAMEPGVDSNDSIAERQNEALPQLYVATLSRRATAAAIDAAIVGTGLLAFAATSGAILLKLSGHAIANHAGGSHLQALRQFVTSFAGQTGLPLNLALIAGAVTGLILLLMYQALFFLLSDATPGMRCARIALCTFDDENPTRRAVRRRAAATLLSACPFGLGFLWAALDEDRLAWHDRISRMYQRSY